MRWVFVVITIVPFFLASGTGRSLAQEADDPDLFDHQAPPAPPRLRFGDFAGPGYAGTQPDEHRRFPPRPLHGRGKHGGAAPGGEAGVRGLR